ncbi:GNAT family N-acetyltransferase [Dyella sp. ASV21]|jgi:GNAT superfamily N-acetyltransferase|uniref:GNAT family N-acetyltransferase n=1 Tax=Dyella sp. ASV21 TaxID=2795114 RepID=UPI0018EA7721|nr:GNAT family N-acetyltransferase [Dyella sp. ASV21]
MTNETNSLHAKDFAAFPEVLAGDHWIEALRDGTPVLIRPLREADRERELAFVNGLSHRSRRYRFLGDFRLTSQAQIDQLMDVDYQQRMAFIALVHDNGVLQEIGVSRYSATLEDKMCECAVTVADEWQNRGLGVLLMRHLIDYARRQGFKRMVSMDSASNEGMRDLASYLGFHRAVDTADNTQVIHTLQL